MWMCIIITHLVQTKINELSSCGTPSIIEGTVVIHNDFPLITAVDLALSGRRPLLLSVIDFTVKMMCYNE